MLELRENKILFQYLEVAAVSFEDNKGWCIQGESKEGHFEVYELSNNIIRFVLPIPVPSFMDADLLSKMILSLQGNIEGIVSVNNDEELFLEYYIHSTLDDEVLNDALNTFIMERGDIRKGFSALESDYKKMEAAVQRMAGLTNNPGGRVPSTPGKYRDEESSLIDKGTPESLWHELEDLDQSNNEDEDNDSSETV